MKSNRRNFLKRSLPAFGAVAALGPLSVVQGMEEKSVPFIDSHVHFYDPLRPQGVPWPPKNSEVLYKPHLPADYRKVTAGLDVVGVVVVEASEWVEDNQWVLDLAKDDPLIAGFVGNLDPNKPDFLNNLKRFSANPIFRGVRFRQEMLTEGFNQKDFRSNLKAVAEQGLSLDVSGNSSILAQGLKFKEIVPDLRIVIDHLPFRDWDTKSEHAALRKIARLKDVYVKISDVPRISNGKLQQDTAAYFPILDGILNEMGPDRIIFGSNWPVSDLTCSYGNVFRIVSAWITTKSGTTIEKFFWKNSLAAYRWKQGGEAARLLRK